MRLSLYSALLFAGCSIQRASGYRKLCKMVAFGLVPDPIMLLECRQKQPADVIRLLFHVAEKKAKTNSFSPRRSRYATDRRK